MANQYTKGGSSRSGSHDRDDNRRSVSASGRNSGSGSSSGRSHTGSGSSNRGFAQNHDLAVEAGRKGGRNSHGGRGRSSDDE